MVESVNVSDVIVTINTGNSVKDAQILNSINTMAVTSDFKALVERAGSGTGSVNILDVSLRPDGKNGSGYDTATNTMYIDFDEASQLEYQSERGGEFHDMSLERVLVHEFAHGAMRHEKSDSAEGQATVYANEFMDKHYSEPRRAEYGPGLPGGPGTRIGDNDGYITHPNLTPNLDYEYQNGFGDNMTQYLDYILSDASIWEDFKESFNFFGVDSSANDLFNFARNWFQKKDPMTLDLDGDGLETVGIDSSNPILFDHTGDGVANATGWISPDDGFLVHDLNGNGQIDNGTELFGDSTPIFNEAGEVIGKAEDGFDALVQQDTNGDGIVNANDDNWQDLRIWQDANSNGTTEDGELHTLESLGIAGIEVAKTENSSVLSNGNEIADLGKFIYADGSEGELGAVSGGLADINLADNPFFREFADTIPLTEEAEALPTMQGSGPLRDLQEAASLSSALVPAVPSYAAAPTKAAQLVQVNGLITQWAQAA